MQCYRLSQQRPVNGRPLKVLAFATDKLRLLLKVSDNIMERIPAETTFVLTLFIIVSYKAGRYTGIKSYTCRFLKEICT